MRAEDLSTPYEEWAGAGERTRGRTVRQLSCCALLLILPSWLAFTSAATQPYAAPVLLRLKAMPVVPPTLRVPVVLMHGIGDSGSSDGMVSLCRSVEEAHPGTHVRCANVADGLASIGVSIGEQVEGFAALVQSDPLLADGFDAIGFSQGALVVRGYIERHNAPVVRRFVSVCGPAAGIGACPAGLGISWLACSLWLLAPYASPLSFADYWKDATDRQAFLRQSRWLADADNERAPQNVSYASKMASLELYVLVQALADTVVVPRESSWHGFWAWGNRSNRSLWGSEQPVVPLHESDGYASDAIGLRTLDKSGRLRLMAYDGEHMAFNASWWATAVLPLVGRRDAVRVDKTQFPNRESALATAVANK